MADLLAPYFSDEDAAIEYWESVRWHGGVFCPHCGAVDRSYRLQSKPGTKNKLRKGVWKCRDCRKQFTAMVGTIFSDSHIPLHIWFMAIHLMNASKKGMSAHQLHRMLGVTYRSAWFMAHRIRYAMTQEPLASKLGSTGGTVEIDEVYIGGKEKYVPGMESKKAPVVSLLDRKKGRVRSFHVERVTVENLKPILKGNISKEATLNTDEAPVYRHFRPDFWAHKTVNHSAGEYAWRDHLGKLVSTNSVEGFFSLLKRGLFGTYHHVSKHHLHRYLAEFDFRYNHRNVPDGPRALGAVKGFEGKRLTYRPLVSKEQKQLDS